ncbi:MAG: hypothetical protein WD766_08575 [Gemmatimonadota bacterium]
MMYRYIRKLPVLGLLLGVLPGCGDASAGAEVAGAAETQRGTRGVVDSVFPIEEEIRRFQRTVGERPTALSGGAKSREALVSAFIDALERSDTLALGTFVMNRAEFIHLYFPHTVYTSAPYELSPEIVWFQMLNHSSRGITRAVQRLAGQTLHYSGYSCSESPTVEGPNRVWERCVVRIAPNGEPFELRLFGLILEREGRFKFVTYGNDL